MNKATRKRAARRERAKAREKALAEFLEEDHPVNYMTELEIFAMYKLLR